MNIIIPTVLFTAYSTYLPNANAALRLYSYPCRSLLCHSRIDQQSPRDVISSRNTLDDHWHNTVMNQKSVLQDIEDLFDDFTNFLPSIFNSRLNVGNSFPTWNRYRSMIDKPDVASMYDIMKTHQYSSKYQIVEEEAGYKVMIDINGVTSDDMKIEHNPSSNTLHVKGKRNVEEDGGTIETTFENHFKLGNNVDVDAVSAIVRDGVLELILPKKIVVDEVRTIAISEDKSRESGLQESDTTLNDANNNNHNGVDCEDGDDGDYTNDLTLNETNDGLGDESAEDTIEL